MNEDFDVKESRSKKRNKKKRRKVKFVEKDRNLLISKRIKHAKNYEFHEEEGWDEV